MYLLEKINCLKGSANKAPKQVWNYANRKQCWRYHSGECLASIAVQIAGTTAKLTNFGVAVFDECDKTFYPVSIGR